MEDVFKDQTEMNLAKTQHEEQLKIIVASNDLVKKMGENICLKYKKSFDMLKDK